MTSSKEHVRNTLRLDLHVVLVDLVVLRRQVLVDEAKHRHGWFGVAARRPTVPTGSQLFSPFLARVKSEIALPDHPNVGCHISAASRQLQVSTDDLKITLMMRAEILRNSTYVSRHGCSYDRELSDRLQ